LNITRIYWGKVKIESKKYTSDERFVPSPDFKDVICHVTLDCAYVIHLQGFRECRIKVPQWILACIAVLRLMSKRVVMLGSFVAG